MAHKIRIRFDTMIGFEVTGKLKDRFTREGVEKVIRDALEQNEEVEILHLDVKEISIKPEGEDEWKKA